MSANQSFVTQARKLWWALDPTCTDERARELFTSRYGMPPIEIRRYPGAIVLCGPIDENGKSAR